MKSYRNAAQRSLPYVCASRATSVIKKIVNVDLEASDTGSKPMMPEFRASGSRGDGDLPVGPHSLRPVGCRCHGQAHFSSASDRPESMRPWLSCALPSCGTTTAMTYNSGKVGFAVDFSGVRFRFGVSYINFHRVGSFERRLTGNHSCTDTRCAARLCWV